MERSFFSVQEAAERLMEPLASLRRELHEHPELSGQELGTLARLRKWFDRPPFEVLPSPVENSLLVRIPGKGPGKRVAIRADMDALPVQEWEGNPIQSKNPGVMHACGHDMHMSFVCGAGLLLAQARERFAGEVCRFRLEVEPSNRRAQALYERLGFEVLPYTQMVRDLPK